MRKITLTTARVTIRPGLPHPATAPFVQLHLRNKNTKYFKLCRSPSQICWEDEDDRKRNTEKLSANPKRMGWVGGSSVMAISLAALYATREFSAASFLSLPMANSAK
ncbi:hypothetical protein ALC57_07397 [Trachymyrmex cornetzi]|uniref:Uncharacterized protein n=1 Tax=Trachymyrmex cornetzi TaxID=471704 RepID=A0A195E5X7_9HYME|nr:hypothetical protein ALC57_07397 [Trachymyrmex cornetzi]